MSYHQPTRHPFKIVPTQTDLLDRLRPAAGDGIVENHPFPVLPWRRSYLLGSCLR